MLSSIFGSGEPGGNLLDRLKSGIEKTRAGLVNKIEDVVLGKKEIDADLLDELEYTLITADIGVRTSTEILETIRQRVDRKLVSNPSEIRGLIRDHLLEVLSASDRPLARVDSPPVVIMMVGVNGAGKTTTTGKLARRLHDEGKTVLIAAADTFRAAAIEQLETWGGRIGVEVAKGQYGGDSAALCYDAWSSAHRRNIEFLLCDTAGRLHTKDNLMQELSKVGRTLAKHDPDAPHEKFLVVDATTGSNALVQAREFHQAAGLTGIILTKLDGSGKGGVAVAIQKELGIPTRFIGTGEKLEDFAAFNREAFVNRML